MTSPSESALARFVLGECSRAEHDEIAAWLRADAENATHLDAIRRLLTPGPASKDWKVDTMWGRLRHDAVQPVRRPAFSLPKRLGSIAAAAGIVAVSLFAAQLLLTPRATPVGERSAPHQYVTRRGERARIELADGTRVTLAPGSTLAIADGYGTGRRVVTLAGEAVFDVVHDSAAAFEVRTATMTVRDVGTRFDVRAYEGDARAVVAVAEGSVSLERGSRAPAVVLTRGALGMVDRDGVVHKSRIGRLSKYFGWTEGTLTFEDEPLGAVLRVVSRWYDLDITLADPSLASRRVSVDFSTSQPGAMVDALGAALGVPVTRRGRVITLGAATPRGMP